MIDVHCHLEQHDYDKDRDDVISKCKKAGLAAIITCCAHPSDFDLSIELVKKYRGFIFLTAALHPEYVKEFSEKQIDDFIERIILHKSDIVAIGETGLDFWWIKECEWQKRQEELFRQFIQLAKELKKPLVIHARDAYERTLQILEQEDARAVCLHMFGAAHLVKQVIENGWHVSLNTIIERSKKHRKVARDMPLNFIMLETDAPWLGPGKTRNDPTSIKRVAELIAEIKGIAFDGVWKACGENAKRFFQLQISSP
ncbi:MAG: TatD family hydrolase [Candidatus Aenigmatarchaeota archaeon]